MAILDTFTNTKKKASAEKAASTKKKTSTKKTDAPIVRAKKGLHIENIIQRPRITEKAAIAADENNAYAFMVDPRAIKSDIAGAIHLIYGVVPIKINIINSKPKKVRRGNKIGVKSGFKKAMVFLKEGDKIEFV